MNPSLRYVKERAQNLSRMRPTSWMVGNNQSRLFSSIPCGKKATTSISSRALGESLWGPEEGVSWRNVGEASESSIVAARIAVVVICPKYLPPLGLPLLGQPIVIPHAVGCDLSEKRDRECVKIQLPVDPRSTLCEAFLRRLRWCSRFVLP